MLKFWKKPYIKERSSDSAGSSPLGTPGLSLSPSSSQGFFETTQRNLSFDVSEVEKLLTDKTDLPKTSRLFKPLVDLISDSETLSYFMQYLETMNVTNLARCLLDIDHVNASLATFGKKVSWKDVKGISSVNKESHGQIKWEFSNGMEYTSALACDISGCYEKVSSKVIVRAPSEVKLNEMQNIEKERLEGLFELSEVFESTVDALRLFYKYFSHKAPYKIILDNRTFENLVSNMQNVSLQSFSEVRDLIFNILEKEYFNDYLRSDYHCKYQISVLTATQVRISDILYNEAALFYFMEFLEQEGYRGLLEFWMAANNFQVLYESSSSNYDAEQTQKDAMVLYDKYFSLQATQPLHLGDKVRFAVEMSICREAGTLPSCFDEVQTLIVKLLENKFLNPFLQSHLYFKFLSELISTVNAGPISRPGGSDCSSEVSISTMNSLLASEDSSFSKRSLRNREVSSFNIDTRQLNDPDALWRRDKYNSLAFGRVNSLGRYETAMEPEPDRHRKLGIESRISKAMKKFVNIEEDKSKEELAWQVAEMYVKDVTSITMPSSEH